MNFEEFWAHLNGLEKFSKLKFFKRFELTLFVHYKKNFLYQVPLLFKTNKTSTINLIKKQTTPVLFSDFSLDFRKVINMYLGKMISVHNNIFEMHRFNIIRLYLTKTYRGRAQALGKPSRGQRTWSNAWTATTNNHVLKSFINYIYKLKKEKERPEKINYKVLKAKIRKSKKKKINLKKHLTKGLWF